MTQNNCKTLKRRRQRPWAISIQLNKIQDESLHQSHMDESIRFHKKSNALCTSVQRCRGRSSSLSSCDNVEVSLVHLTFCLTVLLCCYCCCYSCRYILRQEESKSNSRNAMYPTNQLFMDNMFDNNNLFWFRVSTVAAFVRVETQRRRRREVLEDKQQQHKMTRNSFHSSNMMKAQKQRYVTSSLLLFLSRINHTKLWRRQTQLHGQAGSSSAFDHSSNDNDDDNNNYCDDSTICNSGDDNKNKSDSYVTASQDKWLRSDGAPTDNGVNLCHSFNDATHVNSTIDKYSPLFHDKMNASISKNGRNEVYDTSGGSSSVSSSNSGDTNNSDEHIQRLYERLSQLENMVASQQVIIRKLTEQCRDLTDKTDSFTGVIQWIRDVAAASSKSSSITSSGTNTKGSKESSPRTNRVSSSSSTSNLEELDEVYDDDDDDDEEYDNTIDPSTVSDKKSTPTGTSATTTTKFIEAIDDTNIFGTAPETVLEAADIAGASILSGILAGHQRMLVDVRDAELNTNAETFVQFLELAVLPVAAGLEGLRGPRNRLKIVFPTVGDLLQYRKTMCLSAPEVVALSTLAFDPVENQDNVVVIIAPTPDDTDGWTKLNDLLRDQPLPSISSNKNNSNNYGSKSNSEYYYDEYDEYGRRHTIGIRKPVVILNRHMIPITGPAASFEVAYHLRLLSVQYMSGMPPPPPTTIPRPLEPMVKELEIYESSSTQPPLTRTTTEQEQPYATASSKTSSSDSLDISNNNSTNKNTVNLQDKNASLLSICSGKTDANVQVPADSINSIESSRNETSSEASSAFCDVQQMQEQARELALEAVIKKTHAATHHNQHNSNHNGNATRINTDNGMSQIPAVDEDVMFQPSFFYGMTRAMVIRAYPHSWNVFVDTSPDDTAADFVVAGVFDTEPSTDEIHQAIVTCLEGSEQEDEVVAHQMQQAFEAGQLDRISDFLQTILKGDDEVDEIEATGAETESNENLQQLESVEKMNSEEEEEDEDDDDPYKDFFGSDT